MYSLKCLQHWLSRKKCLQIPIELRRCAEYNGNAGHNEAISKGREKTPILSNFEVKRVVIYIYIYSYIYIACILPCAEVKNLSKSAIQKGFQAALYAYIQASSFSTAGDRA